MTKRLKGAFVLSVLSVLILLAARIVYEQARYPAWSKMTVQTFSDLTNQIYSIQKRTGGFPSSQKELAALIGRPLKNSWGKPIDYRSDNTNHFKLSSTSPYPQWDTFEYDSAHPEQGVTIIRF